MNHIIQRQRIEFELKPSHDVFSMQQQMSEYYQREILPEMAKIFDQLAGDDELLKIDKLVIDLGLIRKGENGSGFSVENLPAVLNRQILSIIKDKQKQGSGEQGKMGSQEVRVLPIIVNAGEQWLQYIQTGLIPWNVSDTGPGWKLKVLEGLATEFILVDKLRKIIRNDEKAVKRIIRDHTESFLVKLVEVLTAREQSRLPELVRELQLFNAAVNIGENNALPIQSNLKGSPNTWSRILLLVAVSGSGISSIDMAEKIITADYQKAGVKFSDQPIIFRDLGLLQPVIEELIRDNKRDVPGKLTGKKNDNLEEDTNEPRKDILAPENNGTSAEPVQPADIKTGFQQDDIGMEEKQGAGEVLNSPAELIPEDGIYVSHAGLILLHPFFRFLFKNISLTEDGRFIDREKQEKAVLILHYLASGNKEPEDHQLVIPKIICCWPLDEPLGIETTLHEQEIVEADDLLRVAISQWEIIKNTSADGLREGFLQRRGKVFSKNGHVHIQVEKNAIDVLLGHLPWNLGIIKLPWMDKIIYVDWC